MARVLILFAHPALQKSRVHSRLIRLIPSTDRITLNDLYEIYPDFVIDVEREQGLLQSHDVVVFQHPFYWYSTPPLLKQWMDLVLEHGWAYGSHGVALRDKWLLPVVTAGGGQEAYQPGGYNGHTVRDFLIPVEQTARLCGMRYAPPWVVFGTHRLSGAEIDGVALRYAELLDWLVDDGLEGLDPASSSPVLVVP
jgi:glutathione-regulated potassium-efflux system ancillary protein KefG